MNSSKKPRLKIGHPFVLPVLAIVLLTLVGLTSYVAFGGETVGAADTRIVSVSVDGSEQVVPTRADTVGELLARLQISLGSQDRVEPSIDTPIIEDNQQISVVRARPIALIEGASRTIISTASSSAREIATAAGLSLFPEDLVEFRQSEENLSEGVVAEEIFIERSLPVTANIYGAIAQYRTRSKTVQDFLTEKSITLEPGATTQPVELNTPITAGLLISINSPGKRTLAITELVKFKIDFVNDPNLAAGQTKINQPGADGERAIIYELTFGEGQETGRRVLQTVVTREPVNEVRARGTKASSNYSVSADKATLMAQAGISPEQFDSVDYIISQESGWRPGAISSNNCIGLGQRCPSGGTNALARDCSDWAADPVCQLQHFSRYANGRYGSWNGARAAWETQHWW